MATRLQDFWHALTRRGGARGAPPAPAPPIPLPALRVAQLVRQQQAEVRARERIEQELQVARLIQQTLLPKSEPVLPGWQISAYYQPARAVGGDFYDFIELPDGRLAIIVGDVTDKGVPAALVMA